MSVIHQFEKILSDSRAVLRKGCRQESGIMDRQAQGNFS